MNVIKFTVYGSAVPKARPKMVMNKYTGRPHMYTAEKTRNWEDSVLGQSLAHKPDKLIEGPIWLMIKIFKQIPKSWSKKKYMQAINGEILPTGRPDLSNYIKSIEDAENGIFWSDDGQVVSYLEGTGKVYGDEPKVEIEIQYEEQI